MSRYYIHDGLFFESGIDLDKHMESCQKCAKAFLAEKELYAEAGKRLTERVGCIKSLGISARDQLEVEQ